MSQGCVNDPFGPSLYFLWASWVLMLMRHLPHLKKIEEKRFEGADNVMGPLLNVNRSSPKSNIL